MQSRRYVPRIVAAAVLATGVVIAGPVRAEPPCQADVQKFCADAPVGVGAVQACLEKHEAELSKECLQRLDDFKARAGALAATCRWDVARFCSDVAPGGGRIARCMQARRDQLSPECKDALEKRGKP